MVADGGATVGGSPLHPPAFTIAQTGHSGSAFTSAVLYASGVACGHEQWWTLPHLDRVDRLDGDSSWLAATAPDWGDYSGAVFHQVRHPLPCIGSLAAYYQRTPDDDPYLARRLAHMFGYGRPTVDDLRDRPVLWAAVTWLNMNRSAATRATLTWRVEAFDAAHVMAVAAAAGLPAPDTATVRTALRAVPRDLNAHGRVGLTWDDLYRQLGRPLTSRIEAAAEAYGYQVPQ